MSLLDFSEPVVMGILNITPDSFSDGGRLFSGRGADINAALRLALQMQQEGASLVDVGGESTRPGATPVSAEEELQRVIPVIEALRRESDIVISIDTSKPEVMEAAIAAGATLVNDVYALQKPGAMEVVAAAIKRGVPLHVCLMHMQGEPRNMQQAPVYDDVVAEVKHFLSQRLLACEAAGIGKKYLLVDPGFGFGKTLEQNLLLIKQLGTLSALACPLLVGVSRKSMIGALTGNQNPGERLAGSLALGWACLQRGARILRVHDVKETSDMLKIYRAIQS